MGEGQEPLPPLHKTVALYVPVQEGMKRFPSSIIIAADNRGFIIKSLHLVKAVTPSQQNEIVISALMLSSIFEIMRPKNGNERKPLTI